MQNRKSALKSHFVLAMDQFLEKLRHTVTEAARLNGGPDTASPHLLNGLLRSLEKDFSGLAETWRDEQLAEVVDEIAVYMIELADELQGRVSSLKKRELCRESSNGKHERNGASRVRR